jgi:hypothetical protein
MLANIQAVSQRMVSSTDSFIIQGKLSRALVVMVDDLDTFPKVRIEDQVIHNHKGEPKDTVTNIKGVLLKTIMAPVEFLYDKPRQLNEFYFVFASSDGYKVVFSWNEIYNTEAGNQFYIVTEMEGKSLREMDERILFISTADLKTGRRYIKGLQTIDVRQID